MPKVLEKKILEKLERIEDLLVKALPAHTALTEEDVLKIVEEGRREYRGGKTKEFDTLIKEKYPHLLDKK